MTSLSGPDAATSESFGGQAESQQTNNKKFFPKKFGGIDKKDRQKQLPNSVKKKRVNFRLRKIIVPKAPIMVLNEMIGAVNYIFVDNPPMPMMNPMMQCSLFTAQCMVDDMAFTGTGPTKQIAKNICAEHAIQYVVTKRCTDPKNRMQMDDGGNPLKYNQMTDETPWAQLASLALFKLFNEWQAQGYTVPGELLRSPDYFNNQGMASAREQQSSPNGAAKTSQPMAASSTAASVPPPPNPSRKMPENPLDRHPVQLLNELFGGSVSYNVAEERGTPPNVIFVMSAEINGKTFKGEGRNKKDAKKNCAIEVLEDLHKIVYPKVEV